MTPVNVIPFSTVDWYGLAATVVFQTGCPFRCPYCQNHELFQELDYDVEEIEASIKINSPFASAVVFSGGEPLHQFGMLKRLAKFTHNLGLLVGIETNGYYTNRIKQMIKEHQVDLICMDVKAPLTQDAYLKVSGIDAYKRVSDSLRLYKLCKDNNVDFEVRTTVFPDFIGLPCEIQQIANSIREIAGDVRYVIQQGNPDHAWKNVSDIAYTRDELITLAKLAKESLSDVRIRTKESGQERIV